MIVTEKWEAIDNIKQETMEMTTENFGLARISNSITLDLHPSYHSRHFGADFGQRYYCDPVYRIETDLKVARGIYSHFGEYGMGSGTPQPKLYAGMQPVDFMNAALGGKFEYRHDDFVWAPDKPLAHIKSVKDLEKIGDIEWESNPLFCDLFQQVEKMRVAYPGYVCAEVQGVLADGIDGQNSLFSMHTPYTTAFRVYGEEILIAMLLDETLATAIFEWLMRQYERLWLSISRRMNCRGTKVHFGDCAATMLSPEVYEKLPLRVYQKLMLKYEGAVIHSCGKSTHLLEAFAQIPKINQLQLGDGTDLQKARDIFPRSSICAFYDPAQLQISSPEQIERKLYQMCDHLRDNFSILCSGADPDTPQQNILTFLKVASKINKTV